MSFTFSTPSIHDVRNMTARNQLVGTGDDQFACLHLTFHGANNEVCTMEVYFPNAFKNKAVALESVINVLTPNAMEDI